MSLSDDRCGFDKSVHLVHRETSMGTAQVMGTRNAPYARDNSQIPSIVHLIRAQGLGYARMKCGV